MDDDRLRCDSCGELIPADQPVTWKRDAFEGERYALCADCAAIYRRERTNG